ncbi:MAG: FadR/GntR family transcriptional regulator [Bryobacteraceae bacterium]
MIQRQTLRSQVVDYLLDLIRSGQVKPGEKLPTEKALTETLGVSRTAIREAVKSLESLDLIVVRPKIGAVVKPPSPTALFRAEHLTTAAHQQQTDLLIEFRTILEVGLASLASMKADDADIAAMEKAIEDHRLAIDTSQPAYQADIAFHVAMAAASKNPFAMMVLQSILGPLTEQRMKTNIIPNSAEDGLRDHHKILAAIKVRNPMQARDAMRAHMRTAEHYWALAKDLDPSLNISTS